MVAHFAAVRDLMTKNASTNCASDQLYNLEELVDEGTMLFDRAR
jgi:hypothetical protein